jgi:beta-glucosidase
MRFLIACGATVLCFSLSAGQVGVGTPHADVERRVDSLLSLMTLEEKVGQLVQYDAHIKGSRGAEYLAEDHAELVRSGMVGSFLNSVGASLNRKIQSMAMTRSRLKIPLLFGYDVIHGFRTIFPIPLAEASTWEPELIRKAARVAAREASSSGIHWTFAPMVDIARDPRWGRIAEGSGEDPLLGSAMAEARVRGFQGEDLTRDDALLACAKHFAAYGGAEGGRDYNSVDVSERTLREVYLPPFEAAARAGVGTFMCSFNEIAGVPNSANRWLLSDLLRGEWKFNGFVVSDWTSIGELQQHGVAGSLADAAALAITAGVDMDMIAGAYHRHLAELVRAGKVPGTVLNEGVRRVLRMKFRLGLFDNPYRGTDPLREEKTLLAPEHRALACEVARRSIVLLKNKGALLPLPKGNTVALIGPLADNQLDLLGCWAGSGREEDVITIRAGLQNELGGRGSVLYARGCSIDGSSRSGFSEAIDAARKADVAIVVMGEAAAMSGEASCRSWLGLPGVQGELFCAVAATGVPVVLVLINGRPLTVGDYEESADAILEAWDPGVEGGNAVADVLLGDYNPSGKLPVTFPRNVGQIPLYYNHKNTGRPTIPGVHFTTGYLDVDNSPLYPFGYGLSYTSFEYSDVAISSPVLRPGGSLTVSVNVRNTGRRFGEEIVQLYLQDVVASVTRPVRELKGFRKIALSPGEEQRVDFSVTAEMLSFYDLHMQRISEPGEFRVFVGGNVRDVRSSSFRFEKP